jgi:hypothetical protein
MRIKDFDLTSIPNKQRKFLLSIEKGLIEAARKDSYFDSMDLSLVVILGHFESCLKTVSGIDWLSNQYKKKKFQMVEIVQYKEVLELYFETLDESTKSLKELFQHQTIDDVVCFIKNKFGSLSKNEIEKQIKETESVRFIEDRGLLVIIPKTANAAKIYGKGTKWCVSGSIYNEFSKYASKGSLYIIILNDRKFSMHIENKQFMNELNQSINERDIQELTASEPFLKFFREIEQEYSNYSDYFSFLAQKGLK